MLTFTVISAIFSPLKTATESQIKELLVNMERAPCNQAEVEKLIAERNGVGSKKFRLEGTRICFLGVGISQSLSNYAAENSTRHIDF